MQKIYAEEQPGRIELPDGARMVIRQMDPGLPIPDLISYYVLEKDRKLYLDQDIDGNSLNIERMLLRWNLEDKGLPVEQRKPIMLYIMSPGGDTDIMWSLVDAIEASRTPVWTINMGVCASAAGLIYLAGHRRLMMKRAKLLIHEGSAKLAGDAVKVMDASESYRKTIKLMKDYILSRTGISASVLNKQRCHDWELDAEYCLAHGVCDKLVDSLEEVL